MPEASANQIKVIEAVSRKYLALKRVAYGGNGVIDFAIARTQIPTQLPGPGQWDNLVHPVDELRKHLVAIKYPYGSPVAHDSIRTELEILKKIKNLNVANKSNFAELVEADEEEIEKGKCHYIVTKAVSTGVSLAQLTEVHPMSLVCHKFLGLGTALQTLHDNGISHGDIKPENIMIEYSESLRWPRIVLVDFGSGSLGATGSELNARLQGDREKFCGLIYQYGKMHTDCECFKPEKEGKNQKNESDKRATAKKDKQKTEKESKPTVIRRLDANAWGHCEPHPKNWEKFLEAMKDEGRATSKKSMRDILKMWEPMAKEGRDNTSKDMTEFIGKLLRAAVNTAAPKTGIADVELTTAIQNPKRLAYRHDEKGNPVEVFGRPS